MTADQLQKALATLRKTLDNGNTVDSFVIPLAAGAHRWLSLLQADETIVEKMAEAIADAPWKIKTSVAERRTFNDYHLAKARAALLAITGKDE